MLGNDRQATQLLDFDFNFDFEQLATMDLDDGPHGKHFLSAVVASTTC